MAYELWDTETRNIIADFASNAVARVAARELAAKNRPAYPDTLALIFEDEHGDSSLIASGQALTDDERAPTGDGPPPY